MSTINHKPITVVIREPLHGPVSLYTVYHGRLRDGKKVDIFERVTQLEIMDDPKRIDSIFDEIGKKYETAEHPYFKR